MSFKKSYTKNILGKFFYEMLRNSSGLLFLIGSMLLFYSWQIEGYEIPYTGIEGAVNVVLTVLFIGIITPIGKIIFNCGEMTCDLFSGRDATTYTSESDTILISSFMTFYIVGVITGYYTIFNYILNVEKIIPYIIGGICLADLLGSPIRALRVAKEGSIEDIMFYKRFWGADNFNNEKEEWLISKIKDEESLKKVLSLLMNMDQSSNELSNTPSYSNYYWNRNYGFKRRILPSDTPKEYKNEIQNCIIKAKENGIYVKSIDLKTILPFGEFNMYETLVKVGFYNREDRDLVATLYLETMEYFATRNRFNEVEEIFTNYLMIDPETAKVIPEATKEEMPKISIVTSKVIMGELLEEKGNKTDKKLVKI